MIKHYKGFTIVELLIVIVVIAILAAISVVAYNGIQTRAENAKTLAGVDQLGKILTIYKTTNGRYPLIGTSGSTGVYTCLGDSTTQCGKVVGPDSSSACNYVGGPTQGSAAFESALKTVTSVIPTVSTKDLPCEGKSVRGVFYYANASDFEVRILYYLKGDQSCSYPAGSSLVDDIYFANGDTNACYLRFPA